MYSWKFWSWISIRFCCNGCRQSRFVSNRALLPSDILNFPMLPAQRFWLRTVSLLDVIALKVTMRARILEKQFLSIKRNMLFLWFFFLLSLRRKTLGPPLYVHVRKVCVLLGVNKKEKERQRPTLGVRYSEV